MKNDNEEPEMDTQDIINELFHFFPGLFHHIKDGFPNYRICRFTSTVQEDSVKTGP